ncbi:NitT/TauT family transport system permease protein [Actinocorallia herbida]|uniref:NitT/TauT family transport system permease protein n=1 Tax=Actinocorallia herbida TaxID=58109 RepID=A0A3N1D9I1_9ACTN|nr:ABC transporter permease [Actinocorallia herbida]ROO90193.1 NitT/TauT family transport system permease protein [Actinocorallia herbida]
MSTAQDVRRTNAAGGAAVGKPKGRSAGRRFLESRAADWVLPLVLVAIVIGIWQAVCASGGVEEYVLPAPGDVVVKMFGDLGMFAEQSVPTLVAIFVGFALAVLVALPIAVGMVYSDIVRRAVYPLLIIAQVVPKVAIAPLFIIWFGFGQLPKVLMVALICFFPVVIDALVGFRATRPESLMLVRSMGASRWQAFWKIRWPFALPSIFAGLKVGITLAVVGAVVAEFVGADTGLGVVLINARGDMDSLTVFASIAWLTVVGFVLFVIVELLERILVPGKRGGRSHEASGSL